MYVDPIYIVLVTIIGVFCILAGIVVILNRYLKVLSLIERNTHDTVANTSSINKLQEHIILLEHTPPYQVRTAGDTDPINKLDSYDPDATQRIPDSISKKAQALSGQLYATGTEQSDTKP